MKMLKPILTLLAVASIAGCAESPTAAARPEAAARRLLSGSPPVANITYVSKKPMGTPTQPFIRWTLNAYGSYDPDTDPITYYWSSSCVYIPNGNAYTYTFDVQDGDTCEVNLYVFDGTGQGNDKVTVHQTTITY